MNNEKIEKQLVSLILECSKQSIVLTKKYLSPTKKLFESVFYQEEISVPVSLNECRNNKYVYFQKVNEAINDLKGKIDKESLKIINESIASNEFKNSISSFVNDLNVEIQKLKYQNDFTHFDTLDKTIQKTIIFSKRPLFVNGFNIQQLLDPSNVISKELEEKFGATLQSLKSLIFNKSDNELYFLYHRKETKEQTIIFYNIKNNELDYLHNKNFFEEFGTDSKAFFETIWKNEQKYLQTLGQYINNNLIELYVNSSLYETITFKDNLYGDISYHQRMEMIKSQNVIKTR